jgi:short chain dehydrogenase
MHLVRYQYRKPPTNFSDEAKFGTIDVLINNAGIIPLSLVESISVKEWDQMIDVNLKGVLYGAAAVLPHMKAKKSGHIITTASVAGHKVFLSLLFTPQRSFLFATLWKGFVRKQRPSISEQRLCRLGPSRQNFLIISVSRMLRRLIKVMSIKLEYRHQVMGEWLRLQFLNPNTWM